MAGSRKKVGGVKARSKVKGRAAPAARPKKKVGGVSVKITEAASSKHRYCPVGCQGDWRSGMWCHDNDCPEVRMIWKAHGQQQVDWVCSYGCPGEEMPSGWTHHWECAFWEAHPELTPFYTHKEEREVVVEPGYNTTQGFLDSLPF